MRKLAALVLSGVLLSGCDVEPITRPQTSERPIDLTADILAGTWRNEQRDGTMVFAADGTFEAKNFPPQELSKMNGLLSPSFDKSRDRIDGGGQWTLDNDPMHVSKHKANVTIFLEPTRFTTGKVALTLYGQWVGDKLALVFYFGDPDLNNTYAYLKPT